MHLTVVLVVVAGLSACRPDPTYEQVVHRSSLSEFARWWKYEQAARQGVDIATIERWMGREPRRLDAPAARRGRVDVSTDLCSFAPDAGPVFDFRLACVRHDVAWRNLRRGLAPNTTAQRRRANVRFEADARTTCARRPGHHRAPCRGLARLYRVVLDTVA